MSTGMKKYGEKSKGMNIVKICLWIKMNVNTTDTEVGTVGTYRSGYLMIMIYII